MVGLVALLSLVAFFVYWMAVGWVLVLVVLEVGFLVRMM